MVALNVTALIPPQGLGYPSDLVLWSNTGSWQDLAMFAFKTISLSFLSLFGTIAVTRSQNILLTNDDGWAVAQIRAQFNALDAAGYNVRPGYSFAAWSSCGDLHTDLYLLIGNTFGPCAGPKRHRLFFRNACTIN